MSWTDYLASALSKPVGIALLCNTPADADAAKRQLYVARAEAVKKGNKSFNGLSISMSPHADDILYIYHQKEVVDEEGVLPDAL